LFLTDVPIIIDGVKTIQIPKIKSKDEYSHFVIKELYKYINTEFILLVQHDSWVLDGNLFDERLYDVDYAGALWPEIDGLACGNGGMSFRSKRLLEVVGKDEFVNATAPEDVSICRVYRRYLEKNYGLVWASDEVCNGFSFEIAEPIQPTFAFHGYFHLPYKPVVVLRRSGAFGDVIQLEPICRHFYNKGYRVVLDTPIHFWRVFQHHFYPIEHFSRLDKRHKYEEYNLDMSYESKPKQLHIDSYLEFCGIDDCYDKVPVLNFPVGEKDRIIKKKYVVIHLDRREQESRNVHGINWQNIVFFLRSKGYEVIQIGLNEHEETGAIEMRTLNENQLMYVVGGCEFFIGCDSAPSHIALALGKRAIIFFGSVNPKVIHPSMDNIIPIHNHSKKPCTKPFCWSDTAGTTGTPCYLDLPIPPCVQYTNNQVLTAIKKII